MKSRRSKDGTLVADENELLRRCQTHDPAALEELIRRFQPDVARLGERMLQNPQEIDEVVGDVFFKVWRKCSSWRGESQARTWIYQVAYRTILDSVGSRSREKGQLDADLPDSGPGPLQVALEGERRAAVERALALLSPDERGLVHMHYFDGLSLAEMASIVGIGRDALKMRLFRIRERLRYTLQSERE